MLTTKIYEIHEASSRIELDMNLIETKYTMTNQSNEEDITLL